MDIRELVTLFTFKTDEAGLKSQETKLKSAISGIKSTLSTFGTVFGAQLAFDTARSVITGLADGIKEANRIRYQIGQILTPDMNLDDTMDQLFKFAQEVGESATDVAKNFRSMAIAAAEVGVSQETALEATQNIAKAIDISKLSGDDANAAFERINQSLRRGQLSGRSFGEMLQTAPEVVKLLGQNLGVSAKRLRELADDGKITTEVLIKAFAKTNTQLEAIFAAKPVSLGEAFTYVYNEIIRVGQALWKLTTGVSYVARQIIYFTQVIVRWGESFVDAVGGGENAVRLFGYAIGVAFGLKALQIILTLTSAIRTLGIAATLASLKFLAIGAAIVFIALAIEDLIGWFQGKDSFIGRVIGPVEDYKKQIDAIASPFKGLKQILTGDFTGGFATLKKGFSDIDGWMQGLIYTAGLVVIAFVAWNAISFAAGLIRAIIAVVTNSMLARGAALLVRAAYLLWNGISYAAGLIASLFKVTAATTAVATEAGVARTALTTLNTLTFSPLIAAIGLIGAAITAVILLNKELEADVNKTQAAMDKNKAEGKPPPTVMELSKETGLNYVRQRQAASATGVYKREGMMGNIEDWWQEQKRKLAEMVPTDVLGVPLPSVKTVPKIAEEQRVPLDASTEGTTWLERNLAAPKWLTDFGTQVSELFKMPVDTAPPIPALPPGAIGPTAPPGPVDNSVAVTAPITNNITITAPVELDANRLAAAVDQRVGAAMTTVVNETARKLSNATPVTEARTGAAP